MQDAVASPIDQVIDSPKCIGIFLDIKKDFDTVSILHLLSKMEGYKICGLGLRIFSNYVSI